MIRISTIVAACVTVSLLALSHGLASQNHYVGSKTCANCHNKNYQTFLQHSKKAKSWQSVAIMLPEIDEQELKECYTCHTTGYGKPGGFVSYQQTPDLADVGCETCHGMGGEHAESGDPANIVRRPTLATCHACHTNDRVNSFNFKPLVYSGAH